ncbi:hypothetical protein LINPERHAP2_LOCUS5830 [Linum perenne]
MSLCGGRSLQAAPFKVSFAMEGSTYRV